MKEILNFGGFVSCFETGFHYSPGWSQTHDPPVSTFRTLEFQFCNTTPELHLLEYFSTLYIKRF